jgi:hypothetical protein
VPCGRSKAVERERFCRSPPPNRQKIAKNDPGEVISQPSLVRMTKAAVCVYMN